MKAISKEIFIIALLLMIVVFMMGMVFYKYMPNNKTIPEPVTYSADTSTTVVLQEISDSGNYDASFSTEDSNTAIIQDVIKSYSIGTTELTSAATKQTYISGKTDPFAEYSGGDSSSDNSDSTDSDTTNNPNLTDSVKQSSDSTGTFFEKKGSK